MYMDTRHGLMKILYATVNVNDQVSLSRESLNVSGECAPVKKIKNKKIVRKLCKMQCKKNIAWRTAAANSDKFTPFTLRKQDCRVFFWCVQPKIGRMCRQIVQIQDLVAVAPTRHNNKCNQHDADDVEEKLI